MVLKSGAHFPFSVPFSLCSSVWVPRTLPAGLGDLSAVHGSVSCAWALGLSHGLRGEMGSRLREQGPGGGALAGGPADGLSPAPALELPEAPGLGEKRRQCHMGSHSVQPRGSGLQRGEG